MSTCVIIKFTGDVSIYQGTLLFYLAEQGIYDFADKKYGCSAIPASPEIAREIKIWVPGDIKTLCRVCNQAIWNLSFKFNRQIPVEIKIEEGG